MFENSDQRSEIGIVIWQLDAREKRTASISRSNPIQRADWRHEFELALQIPVLRKQLPQARISATSHLHPDALAVACCSLWPPNKDSSRCAPVLLLLGLQKY